MAEIAQRNNGLGPRFWIPIMLTSLLSVGMGSWAIFERAANTRIYSQVVESKGDIKEAKERNILQDQQILMINRDILELQKQTSETLRLMRRHMGIPE